MPVEERRGRKSRNAIYAQLTEGVEELRSRLGGLPSPVEADEIWGDSPQGPPTGSGFVHLDDLTVTTGTVTRVWTSANDNGGGGTTAANTSLTAQELQVALDAPLSSLLEI